VGASGAAKLVEHATAADRLELARIADQHQSPLREVRDPSLIEPGAIVVAGDEDAPAVAEVVEIVDKPAGKVVHLRLLPGVIEDYQALVRRAITPA
jgi:hypothetical protein